MHNFKTFLPKRRLTFACCGFMKTFTFIAILSPPLFQPIRAIWTVFLRHTCRPSLLDILLEIQGRITRTHKNVRARALPDCVSVYELNSTLQLSLHSSCVWVGCLTSQLTIFQSYTAHKCAGGLKSWTYGRAPNVIDNSWGSLTCPSKHRHGTNLFIRWFRYTAPISRLLRSHQRQGQSTSKKAYRTSRRRWDLRGGGLFKMRLGTQYTKRVVKGD